MLCCGICIVLNLIRPKVAAKLKEFLGITKRIQDDYSDWKIPVLKSATKLQQGYAIYLRSNESLSDKHYSLIGVKIKRYFFRAFDHADLM